MSCSRGKRYRVVGCCLISAHASARQPSACTPFPREGGITLRASCHWISQAARFLVPTTHPPRMTGEVHHVPTAVWSSGSNSTPGLPGAKTCCRLPRENEISTRAKAYLVKACRYHARISAERLHTCCKKSTARESRRCRLIRARPLPYFSAGLGRIVWDLHRSLRRLCKELP